MDKYFFIWFIFCFSDSFWYYSFKAVRFLYKEINKVYPGFINSKTLNKLLDIKGSQLFLLLLFNKGFNIKEKYLEKKIIGLRKKIFIFLVFSTSFLFWVTILENSNGDFFMNKISLKSKI